MMGALLAVAGTAAQLAFSGEKASLLESELQRKTKETRELEHQMLSVKNTLEGFKDEEMKLVRSMYSYPF